MSRHNSHTDAGLYIYIHTHIHVHIYNPLLSPFYFPGAYGACPGTTLTHAGFALAHGFDDSEGDKVLFFDKGHELTLFRLSAHSRLG